MREAQVIVVACHPRNGTAYHISLARSAALAPYWLPMGDNAAGLLADPPDPLRAFVRDGRITMLPAKRTRRRLLLDQVAQAFEPGRTYPEAEVDQILKAFFDDHCALRRHLIDEEFMSRTADGLYWQAAAPSASLTVRFPVAPACHIPRSSPDRGLDGLVSRLLGVSSDFHESSRSPQAGGRNRGRPRAVRQVRQDGHLTCRPEPPHATTSPPPATTQPPRTTTRPPAAPNPRPPAVPSPRPPPLGPRNSRLPAIRSPRPPAVPSPRLPAIPSPRSPAVPSPRRPTSGLRNSRTPPGPSPPGPNPPPTPPPSSPTASPPPRRSAPAAPSPVGRPAPAAPSPVGRPAPAARIQDRRCSSATRFLAHRVVSAIRFLAHRVVSAIRFRPRRRVPVTRLRVHRAVATTCRPGRPAVPGIWSRSCWPWPCSGPAPSTWSAAPPRPRPPRRERRPPARRPPPAIPPRVPRDQRFPPRSRELWDPTR